jgi:hypothetical protein
LGHPYIATSVATAFFEQIVHLHGLPASIVSDQDPVFTSTMWKELFRLCGTTLRTSSAFQPQLDTQSEMTNRIIAVYLRCSPVIDPSHGYIGCPRPNSATTHLTRRR